MDESSDVKKLHQRIEALEAELTRYKTAWNGLEQDHEWFSQIVQGSPIAAFVIDSSHRIVTCNKAFERLTGFKSKEIIGTDNQWMCFYETKRPVMADFVVDQASEATLENYYADKYRKSLTIVDAYEAEDYFPALGDHGKWIFFTAAPLKNAEGKITGAIETLQDTTEQKLALKDLVESERRLRTLSDFVPYPIVVFTRKGKVHYLNPAFAETFGWHLHELEGRGIPWDPSGQEPKTDETIRALFKEQSARRYAARRRTKDGRVLDVIVRLAGYSDASGKPAGVLMILRDVTREKREAQTNESILKISLALPEYVGLTELLDFISQEIKRLAGSEGAIVMLLDEQKGDIFILGAAYEDQSLVKRVKEIRFPAEKLVAGKVIKTGKPLIDNRAYDSQDLYRERDQKLGYQTRTLAMVPLKSKERIIGVLAAINKKVGDFEQDDIKLLNTIGSTVALSIENARFSRELRGAYQEVRSLNRAKDKMINHLSHELRTPVSILAGSLSILSKKLNQLEEESWKATFERAHRNLNRLVDIQDQVSDIIQGRPYETKVLLTRLLDECTDELQTLIADADGDEHLIDRVRNKIDALYGPKQLASVEIHLDQFVAEILNEVAPQMTHRNIRLNTDLATVPPVRIPREVLHKIVVGLIKNTVENTPDAGRVDIRVETDNNKVIFVVRDYGVGITRGAQRRIFEGFFPTGDTMNYSSKRPYDFNAGGKGADLLRMKIFSERYGFAINMSSTRCGFIPSPSDQCPGNINACEPCTDEKDCEASGGTTFTLLFGIK